MQQQFNKETATQADVTLHELLLNVSEIHLNSKCHGTLT
jgi:hypothetical protein